MSRAKQTGARLIDQRARRRATQQLIENHRAEYRDLYEWHRRNATSEAQILATAAAETPHTHEAQAPRRRAARPGRTPTAAPAEVEPPRLMTGRRKPGQEPVDRIDVARCPDCIKHHDSGHACPNCGSKPGQPTGPAAPPIPRDRIDEAILRMVAQGHHNAQIAFDLRLTEEAVQSRRDRLGLAREEAS